MNPGWKRKYCMLASQQQSILVAVASELALEPTFGPNARFQEEKPPERRAQTDRKKAELQRAFEISADQCCKR